MLVQQTKELIKLKLDLLERSFQFEFEKKKCLDKGFEFNNNKESHWLQVSATKLLGN